MRPLGLDAAIAELGANFATVKRTRPKDTVEITLYGNQRDEVIVHADSLSAVISNYRAVLYQRERKPFTEKDVNLRNWVLKNYDKTTPTPFPWGGDSEPSYEVEGRNISIKLSHINEKSNLKRNIQGGMRLLENFCHFA